MLEIGRGREGEGRREVHVGREGGREGGREAAREDGERDGRRYIVTKDSSTYLNSHRFAEQT